jgi:hypothetical protein
MSYIGNTPFTAAFQTDTFSGNGTTTAFTMSVAPANTSSILVVVTGVTQDPSTYSVSGTTLTFSAAPPTGTSNISVRYLGIPASGVTTTAYRTVTDTTATAGQTTFSIPSYTVGYVDVYRNGSRLAGSDYTATSGTSVVLVNAASAGDTITTESFYVSSVLNALPNTGGTVSGQVTVNSATGQKPLIAQVNGTEVFEVDASGNVGIGTSSPVSKLNVNGGSVTLAETNAGTYNIDFQSRTASTNARIQYDQLTNTTGQLLFYTNGGSLTERMRISAAGYVTTPSQPRLSCLTANTNGTTLAGYYALGSATPDINVGSCFSTTTRVFTCPVAGYYRISVSASNNDGQAHFLAAVKNGTAITSFILFYTIFTTGAQSVVVSCAAGDTLGALSRFNTGLYGAQLSIELVG